MNFDKRLKTYWSRKILRSRWLDSVAAAEHKTRKDSDRAFTVRLSRQLFDDRQRMPQQAPAAVYVCDRYLMGNKGLGQIVVDYLVGVPYIWMNTEKAMDIAYGYLQLSVGGHYLQVNSNTADQYDRVVKAYKGRLTTACICSYCRTYVY